jgi:hypothetical protein
MVSPKMIVASALAIATTCGAAMAQSAVPPGRVFAFHSQAAGACPGLDWHLVVGPNNSLSGMLAWDDMKAMAHVTGSVTPARTFTMTAKEVGGQGRTANITGQVRTDGWLVASIKGPKIECNNITVSWYTPAQAGGGG